MITILFLVVGTAVSAVLYQMYLVDRLVRWEYEHHREQWERDGKPDGYFWHATECAFWSSDVAKKQVGFVWLFKTPRWIAERPECRRWLFQMRGITWVGSLAIASLVVRILFHLLVR